MEQHSLATLVGTCCQPVLLGLGLEAIEFVFGARSSRITISRFFARCKVLAFSFGDCVFAAALNPIACDVNRLVCRRRAVGGLERIE